MERLKWETDKGYNVLKVDFSNLDQDALIDAFDVTHHEIVNSGEENIVVITNIENVMFDRKVTRLFEAMSEKHKPFISLSAFYSANILQKMAIEAIGKLTEREFHIFRSEDELKVWMDEKLN
ncbi:MAG: hypothetical protein PWP51_741 [Clostridiales bacterium]|jgi:hypothetical protein|nr:hypothetical protein [Clostridiales bacterium]MDN5298188.1 hypothetical protein [Clostridiales bacterium]